MWNPEIAGQVEEIRRQHGHGRGRSRGGPGFGPGLGGPPPWLAQMFGPEFGGRGRGGGRGPRVRRGDVRSAILDVLSDADTEINGYQVIQQIAERSQGAWRPSPGSVYPTISQLEDEGLVETVVPESGGKKVLRLTEAGRSHVTEQADELAAVWAPFEEPEDDGDHANLKQVIGQTMGAVWQVAVSGSPTQQQRAAEILADTRRKLYGLLADGPEEE
jgi:DNA-binding PadR family transcriptional regulator